jgi:hypothetical protein
MAIDSRDVDQFSIVLIGHFQVPRFHPHESAVMDALTDSDIEQLHVTMLLPNDVVAFETQFLSVVVEQGKISVSSKLSAPIPEKARDFIAALIAGLDMPTTALGINRDFHFPIESADKFRNLRDEFIQKDRFHSIMKNPLVRALVMQSDRYDTRAGRIVTRIEPSLIITQGLFIQVNDHFDLPSGTTAMEVADNLAGMCNSASENANSIISHIRSLTT